jgi:hypothetical protein
MQVSQQLKLIAAFLFSFIIFLIDCLSIGDTIRIRIYKTSFPSVLSSKSCLDSTYEGFLEPNSLKQ